MKIGFENDRETHVFLRMKCNDCSETNTTPGRRCPHCGSFNTVPGSY